MPTCIYCRAEQDQPFLGVDHIIPKAFWPFDKKHSVVDCVCDECNRYFGKKIEQIFNRESVEGMLRAIGGVKSKQQGVFLGGTRLSITVTEPTDWKGVTALLDRKSKGAICKLYPRPTVAFRGKVDREWTLIPEVDLNDEILKRYSPDVEVLAFGPGEEDIKRLIQRLGELGIQRANWSNEARSGLTPIFANSPNDDTTLRAISKIGINFLASVMEDPKFILRNDFDGIRNYARHGLVPSFGSPIQIFVKGMLRDEGRLRHRHAIILNWDTAKDAILCLVTLFGYQLYQVTLCPSFRGVWRPLGVGRIFDRQKRVIIEIPGVDLWPPIAWARSFWGDFAGL